MQGITVAKKRSQGFRIFMDGLKAAGINLQNETAIVSTGGYGVSSGSVGITVPNPSRYLLRDLEKYCYKEYGIGGDSSNVDYLVRA